MPSKRQKNLDPEDGFGLAVREYRTRRGLSQEQLGFEADLHRTFVSDIERGARNPTVRTVWRLARALAVKPSDLIKLAEEHVPAAE
jgi:transcriptional regulator with XRE-family HTH domain